MRLPRLAPVVLALCGAGVALHLYTVVSAARNGSGFFLAALFLWSCAPYAVAAALSRFARVQELALGGSGACLIADAFMHYSVFVAPKGSTAALGLLFMPLWNLVVIGPLGALLVWFALKVHGRRENAL